SARTRHQRLDDERLRADQPAAPARRLQPLHPLLLVRLCRDRPPCGMSLHPRHRDGVGNRPGVRSHRPGDARGGMRLMQTRFNHVLVTGGAGYVGAVLVPKLLAESYAVTVLDLFLYGEDALAPVKGNPRLRLVKGDLRSLPVVEAALAGVDAVIYLACISNDPSFELDPALGKSINLDGFRPLVRAAKAAGV